MKEERIAIIDLGTNTFHLLVAQCQGSGLEILFEEEVPVRLGKGGISKGILTEQAMDRALSTLTYFKEKITVMDVSRVQAVATSAFRNAKNGTAFQQRILAHTGISVTIISGDREADYIYQGVKASGAIGKDNVLIMDIGGGSVEFIIASGESVLWKKSFEVGAQRLVDNFHHSDPIGKSETEKINNYLQTTLEDLSRSVERFGPKLLIGASGTFDTLMEIYLAKEKTLAQTSICGQLSLEDFGKIHDKLMVLPSEKRALIPGMTAFRVDMIVVASCLVRFIIDRYGLEGIRTSRYALKEGVAYSLLFS